MSQAVDGNYSRILIKRFTSERMSCFLSYTRLKAPLNYQSKADFKTEASINEKPKHLTLST